MKWLVFLVVALTFTWSEAQMNSTGSPKRMKFLGVDFGFSMFGGTPQDMSISEYQSLMVGNSVSYNDIYGYTQSSLINTWSNSIVQLAVSFNLLDNSGNRFYGDPQIRFGLSYNNMVFSSDYYIKNYRYTIDTVFINGNANSIDSTGRVSFFAQNTTNRLRVSTQILWQTKPKYRIFVYGGLGFSAGFSTSSYINYGYTNDGRKENFDQNGNFQNSFDSYFQTDFKMVNTNPWSDYAFNLPLGFDVRLGNAKKEKVWRYLHYFVEFAPTYWVSSSRGLAPKGTAGILLSWGLRFRMLDWL